MVVIAVCLLRHAPSCPAASERDCHPPFSCRMALNYGIAAEAAGLPACVSVIVKNGSGQVVDAERWLRLTSAARGDGVLQPGHMLRRSFAIGATSEQARCRRLVLNGTAPNGTWETDTDADWPGGPPLLHCAPH